MKLQQKPQLDPKAWYVYRSETALSVFFKMRIQGEVFMVLNSIDMN